MVRITHIKVDIVQQVLVYQVLGKMQDHQHSNHDLDA